MLNSCASWLADKLFDHCHLEVTRHPIYVYGFELLLSTLSSVISILLVSAIFSILPMAIEFLLVFITLRLFSGGYHAQTYGRCFVLTNFVFVLVIAVSLLLTNYFPADLRLLTCFILTTAATILIFLLAPIRNSNHPLTVERYKRNKRVARILVIILGCVSLLILLVPLFCRYSTLLSITLAAVAVMMIIPKFIERRNYSGSVDYSSFSN